MYGVKQLALLALGLLATGSMAKEKKTTTVGLETAERSRSVKAEINECVTVNEYGVHTVVTSRMCQFFRANECMGHNVMLAAGEHHSNPVEVGSFVCH
ncbi:hypothetical protein BJX96DRAFT_177962 [Aspergillus floccosus]